MTRRDYLVVGLQVLADHGHVGLKLAEVCRRLEVTSGSFYHYFESWSEYRRDLIAHWKSEATTSHIKWVSAEPDPRRRIEHLVGVAVRLDHATEMAMRAWGCVDADVRAVQIEVDSLRHGLVLSSARQIARDENVAKRFADSALYLLVGYEQAALHRDPSGLEAILRELLAALDRVSDVPARRESLRRFEQKGTDAG